MRIFCDLRELGLLGECAEDGDGNALFLGAALATGGDALYTIPGMPPTLIDPPKGDAFACRNEYALAIDYEKEPPLLRVTDTHYAATWLLDPRAPRITPPIGVRRHGI